MKTIITILVGLLIIPSVSFASTFNKSLYYGLQNDQDVSALQEFLTVQGDYSGPITGNFYSLTLAGVKSFQTRNNISPVSGYFGVLSRGVANSLLEVVAPIEETGTTTVSITPPMYVAPFIPPAFGNTPQPTQQVVGNTPVVQPVNNHPVVVVPVVQSVVMTPPVIDNIIINPEGNLSIATIAPINVQATIFPNGVSIKKIIHNNKEFRYTSSGESKLLYTSLLELQGLPTANYNDPNTWEYIDGWNTPNPIPKEQREPVHSIDVTLVSMDGGTTTAKNLIVK